MHFCTQGTCRRHVNSSVRSFVRGPSLRFLFRRIAWRLQALAEGDISERACQRALEIAQDVDLRICGPRPNVTSLGGIGLRQSPASGRRLPQAGTVLVREYKNRMITVQVL